MTPFKSGRYRSEGPSGLVVDLDRASEGVLVNNRGEDSTIVVAMIPMREFHNMWAHDIVTEYPATFDLEAL